MTAEQTLKKKIQHNGGREWCGYLTPVEIVFVVYVWKYKPCHQRDYDWAVESIKKGECIPRNFSFIASDPSKLK